MPVPNFLGGADEAVDDEKNKATQAELLLGFVVLVMFMFILVRATRNLSCSGFRDEKPKPKAEPVQDKKNEVAFKPHSRTASRSLVGNAVREPELQLKEDELKGLVARTSSIPANMRKGRVYGSAAKPILENQLYER